MVPALCYILSIIDKSVSLILQTDVSLQYSGPTQTTFIGIQFIKSSFKRFFKYCKTLHYLLDKAKIENKSHLIFSQKVCGKQDENFCKRLVISVTFTNVNHWSFSQINHMSTKISWLARPECVWSQLVQGFLLQKLCQTT